MLIYLDQNFFSSIAKHRIGRAEDEQIGQLDELLREKVAAGKLLCPYSAYHLFETAKYDDDEARQAVCDVVGELSLGNCFRHHLDRVEDELELYMQRSLLQRPADDLRAQPLGIGLECLPRNTISPQSQDHVSAPPPEAVFGRIVDFARRTPSLRPAVQAFSEQLHFLIPNCIAVKSRRLR